MEYTERQIDDLRHGVQGSLEMFGSVGKADMRQTIHELLQLESIALSYRTRALRAEARVIQLESAASDRPTMPAG